MDDVKRILVISRSTKYCRKAVHYGISLSKKYGAELSIMHSMHDPFGLLGWSLLIQSLRILEEEQKKMRLEVKSDLDKIVALEKGQGLHIERNL